MMKGMDNVFEQIYRKFVESGMTQSAFCQKAHITCKSFNEYLRGDVELSLKQVRKMMNALDMDEITIGRER